MSYHPKGPPRLRLKVMNTTLRTSRWWGIPRAAAAEALDQARLAVLDPLRTPWPDPSEAEVRMPGNPDAEIVAMAKEGVQFLVANGYLVSVASVWRWCQSERGGRKNIRAVYRLITPLMADVPGQALWSTPRAYGLARDR